MGLYFLKLLMFASSLLHMLYHFMNFYLNFYLKVKIFYDIIFLMQTTSNLNISLVPNNRKLLFSVTFSLSPTEILIVLSHSFGWSCTSYSMKFKMQCKFLVDIYSPMFNYSNWLPSLISCSSHIAHLLLITISS